MKEAEHTSWNQLRKFSIEPILTLCKSLNLNLKFLKLQGLVVAVHISLIKQLLKFAKIIICKSDW